MTYTFYRSHAPFRKEFIVSLKCEQCGSQLGDKYHEVQINGAFHYFCPTQYAPGAPNCLSKFLRAYKERGGKIRQYRVISFVS